MHLLFIRIGSAIIVLGICLLAFLILKQIVSSEEFRLGILGISLVGIGAFGLYAYEGISEWWLLRTHPAPSGETGSEFYSPKVLVKESRANISEIPLALFFMAIAGAIGRTVTKSIDSVGIFHILLGVTVIIFPLMAFGWYLGGLVIEKINKNRITRRRKIAFAYLSGLGAVGVFFSFFMIVSMIAAISKGSDSPSGQQASTRSKDVDANNPLTWERYPEPSVIHSPISQEEFNKKLSSFVPNWREINYDPNFIDWLKRKRDPGTGKTWLTLINEGYESRDLIAVVGFFLEYEKISNR